MKDPGSLSGKVSVESRGNIYALFASLLWAAIVLAKYFLPIFQVLPYWGTIFRDASGGDASGPGLPRALWESFRVLSTAAIISAVTWSWGGRIRRWLGLEILDVWVRFALDFGFGLLVLGLYWVGTGLTGLWVKPLWTAVAGFFLFGLLADLTVRAREGNWKSSFSVIVPRDKASLFLLVCGLGYWFYSILQNLAPETFYDSMVYHLAVPSYWLFHHGLRDFPGNFFSNYPYGAETFFLNGLVFQGTEAAKALHAVSFGVCALLAGGWAREISGEKAGWLAFGLVLTLPLFALNTWTTQVEGFLALALLLFLYSLTRALGEKGRAWALAAGLFGGLSLATKYTAFLSIGCALLVLIFQVPSFYKRGNKGRWGMMTFGVLLILGPWVLKNLATTGNPFFPYFMDYFSGRHLSPESFQRLLQEQRAWGSTDFWSWVTLPWNLTFAHPDGTNFCGPMALALFPLLFLFRFRHTALSFLGAWTPMAFLAGLGVTHVVRFSLTPFILLYVLLAASLAGGKTQALRKGVTWIACVSAIFCFSYLAAINFYYYSCAGIWRGKESRAHYLMRPEKITPYYSAAQWISSNLPQDARLLVAGDARGLYYERPFLTNTVFDEQVLAGAVKNGAGSEGVLRRLRREGVDALVVNGQEGIRTAAQYHHYDLTGGEWKRLDDFIQRGTELLYLKDFQAVYRVLPALKNKPLVETPDLLLFFSEPATRFARLIRENNTVEAGPALEQVKALYPFSNYWMRQSKDSLSRASE